MNHSRNFWPLGVIAAFALFISGTVALIVMASTQQADLVSGDYYEQELKYQAQMESLSRAQQLGEKAGVRFEEATRLLTIALPAEQIRAGVRGRIELYRPSSADCDRQLPMHPREDGRQTVIFTNLVPGLWQVRVSWTVGDQDYLMLQKITNSAH